ncbi:MAG: hypothetical protein RLN79_08440 [Cytophagales bacterium]
MKFNKKISGHALLYALIVTSIITIMSSFALLKLSNSKFIKLKRSTRAKLIEAERNLLKLALSKFFQPEADENPFVINLIENINSSVYKGNWGAFELLILKNTCDLDSLISFALIGELNYRYRNAAIYLKNQNQALNMSGHALIRGNAYLPKAGIRKAIINGEAFSGKKLVYGETFISSQQIPEPDFSGLNNFIVKHRLGINENTNIRDSILNSFAAPCKYLNFKRNAILNECYYKGNIIITASEKIYVSNKSELEDVILIAPQIEIEEGSNLCAQLIASEQIIISESCILKYPSLIFLEENEKNGLIRVAKNSKIQGLLVYKSSELINQKARLFIDQGVEFTGLLYSESKVDLKGDITGTIICDNVQYSTEQNLYLSSLHNVNIDNNALPNYFSLTGIYENKSDKFIMKWLN